MNLVMNVPSIQSGHPTPSFSFNQSLLSEQHLLDLKIPQDLSEIFKCCRTMLACVLPFIQKEGVQMREMKGFQWSITYSIPDSRNFGEIEISG